MSDILSRIRSRVSDAPLPTEYLLDDAADLIEELCEACQALSDAYTGNWIECEEAVAKARSALAKARGEPS